MFEVDKLGCRVAHVVDHGMPEQGKVLDLASGKLVGIHCQSDPSESAVTPDWRLPCTVVLFWGVYDNSQ